MDDVRLCDQKNRQKHYTVLMFTSNVLCSADGEKLNGDSFKDSMKSISVSFSQSILMSCPRRHLVTISSKSNAHGTF